MRREFSSKRRGGVQGRACPGWIEDDVGPRPLGQWAKATPFRLKKLPRGETVRNSICRPVRCLRAHALCKALICEKKRSVPSSFSVKSNSNFSKLLIALCFPSSWVCVYVRHVCQCISPVKGSFITPICLPKITFNVLAFVHHVWAYACKAAVMLRCN